MKDTKDRIIAEGLDLLTRNGFAGVTLGVLAQQTGMSKSGLFAHFGSKSEVQLRLLDESMQVATTTIFEPSMKAPVGLPRIRAVFERWLGWTAKAGLHGGCPIVGGFFEFDDAPPDDPVRQRLAAIETQWRRFLDDLTSTAVNAGHLKADLDIDQFVWEMCGIYLSHHVSYRFTRDPRATERALTAFEGLINRSSSVPFAKKKVSAKRTQRQRRTAARSS
ncbi:MAG: TetR/AcrR family transcriptional regulator [Deltaproteobacteria bacterium]|nr:TetR/AcrR family transcriptional regulator [Deltaproteobacteria bacterium]